MISRFMNSSPALGSVLTAQSLEPASDSVSPFLSAPNPLTFCLSLSLSQKQIKLQKILMLTFFSTLVKAKVYVSYGIE